MPHSHQIYDSDKHFVIDPITRNIANNSSKITIMQYDHNSERFTFEIPRVIEGHDMSLSDVVRVHFINIGSTNTNTNPGVYEVDDVAVSLDDQDTITFSWLISGASTKYNGSLHFAIRFYCLSDESEIEYSWGTNIYSGINVANSLDNSETIVEDYVDVLEKWKQDVIKDIPTKLPNPRPLTFIGAVTGSYDGSEALTVEIPSGGGGGGSTVELDTTLTQSGKAADSKAVGNALAGKQNTISDLEAIRTGASKGATALQSVPNTYRTAAAQDVIDSGKVDKVTGKGLSSNDYTAAAKAKVDAIPANPKYTDTVYDDTALKERVATIEGKESVWDAKSDFSGSYNDLTDKPTIPAEVTPLIGTTGMLTPTQVYDAVSEGIPVMVQYLDDTYGFLSFTTFNAAESLYTIVSQTIVYYNGVYVLAELSGAIQTGRWMFNSTVLAEKKDIPTVPSSLKNPNALTIKIGSTTVTYDGSTAETVEIADGSEVSY